MNTFEICFCVYRGKGKESICIYTVYIYVYVQQVLHVGVHISEDVSEELAACSSFRFK